MENRTKEDVIIVDLQSKESLRNALDEFKEKIIKNDLELCSGDDYLKCFMKLVDGEVERISVDDIKDIDFVDEVLRISDFEGVEDAEDEYYEPFSNVAVFSAALAYDDLLDDMLSLAYETIKLVNDLGDVYDLWTDECHVFGVDMFVAIALKYPEYTYLFSEYILSNWDTEHADYVFEAMSMLKDKWGFDTNILKAIAYCKDEELFRKLVRIESFNYETQNYSYEYTLLNHFRENPVDYNYFKSQYLECAKKNKLEPRDNHYYSTVEVLFSHFAPYKTEEESRTEILIEDTYENEIAELTAAFNANVSSDFRKPVYDLKSINLDKIKRKYVVSRKEQKSDKGYEELRKDYDECINDFCRSNILKDKKSWNATEEEKAPFYANCKQAAEIITAYFFDGESFDKVESIVMPMLGDYVDSSLNDIVWEFSDELLNRAIYMFARFPYEKRMFDFWSRWQYEQKENTGVAFFDYLLELGLSTTYAFKFLIKNYMRTFSYYDIKENLLALAFHTIYPKYDLYEEIKTLPANLIVFALEQAAQDETFRPQLEKFANHINRRVRTDASFLLRKYNF